MNVPCGFDQYGRSGGLQFVGGPRVEAALLQATRAVRVTARSRPTSADRPETGVVPPTAKAVAPDARF
jgi:Asp-tRNA(Asn)/Glu-tRNA(Gln) amidotransferase A subunit family amidase